MAEKTVAFIVARLSSSRMAGKHFCRIGNKAMILWIIDQLKTCKEIDEIVIATVAEPGNKPLRELAGKENISCFWYEGEIDHVTTRLCAAAEHHNADICLLISGDCPLIYGTAIDILLKSFKKDPESNVLRVNTCESLSPALYGVEIARREAWRSADELSDKPELKEHHFPIIGMKSDLFAIHQCSLPEMLYAPVRRLFVDTWADLEFLNRIYDELDARKQAFVLPNVLRLLEEQPELLQINQHVHQRRLKEDIKRILFIVDAGGEFGYGHLMRSLELGLQIVERLSWPVYFVVDDSYAKKLIEERGFKALYGALQRQTRDNSVTDYSRMDIGQYDMAIIDLADRPVSHDWREEYFTTLPVVVIDKMQEWSADSDLVIIPGVTASLQKIKEWQADPKRPRILSGQEYVILRREIRNAVQFTKEKEFDLLLYVHDEQKRTALAKNAVQCGLSVAVVDGNQKDFPVLLARSHYYFGGFGYSFYEALALAAIPVTVPGKVSDAGDAILFYDSYGMTPCIIDWDLPLAPQMQALSTSIKIDTNTEVTDGTPLMIQEIAQCMTTFTGSKWH